MKGQDKELARLAQEKEKMKKRIQLMDELLAE